MLSSWISICNPPSILLGYAKYDTVIEGEANLNLVIGLAKAIIDISGVLGFAIIMLLVAKINHYLNTSTSGGWTTSWLLVNGLIPLFWYTGSHKLNLVFIGYHGFDHFIGEPYIPMEKIGTISCRYYIIRRGLDCTL